MTSFGEVEGIFADYLANRDRYDIAPNDGVEPTDIEADAA